ncbi:lipase [Streptomyces sp. NA04227]|uniref:GDSL-type esterase/lipase family protein n=1 Tax=Streptomyces sp. NA04227 TaxID=2742136 RepID=UPI00158FE0DE|nr:GDSL-type esterase/lipase family protein [Streptomyces sp. NA04227]QKW07095.1 lipase [Streptomyces sp. NA04227]
MHHQNLPFATDFTADLATELVRGAVELEHTERGGVLPHRLPAWARSQYPDPQLAMVESQPSGVRLVFRTRATVIELDVLPTKRIYTSAPPRPDGLYELLVDGRPAGQARASGGNVLTIDMTTGAAELTPGPTATIRFEGLGGDSRLSGRGGADGDEGAAAKDVEIWLPHNETTELIALRTDAPVEAAPETGRRVWLHHGSSISHGTDAAGPLSTWPALAASLGGVELLNLGFGGSALLDPFTARTMRELPADLISVKIGINLVNTDAMRLRAFTPAVHGFLDTLREGHPTTPLLVISPLLCPIHEETPGPSLPDLSTLGTGELRFRAMGEPAETASGKLTLAVIRRELSRIVEQRAAEDPHLYYLDGRRMYGEQDAVELPLPDALHPDPVAHRRIGRHFADLAFAPGGPFGRVQPSSRSNAPTIGPADSPP